MLRDPEASRHLAEAAGEGYLGIAEQLREARPELSEAQVDAVAKLDFTLVQSLGILWLLAPGSLPSGDELARGVAVIAAPSTAERERGQPRRVTSSSASATDRMSAVDLAVRLRARQDVHHEPVLKGHERPGRLGDVDARWKSPAANAPSRIPR